MKKITNLLTIKSLFLILFISFTNVSAMDTTEVSMSNIGEEIVSFDYLKADVESNDTPDKVESTLMREIMKQIHNDYKTTQIVIAIDDFQKVDPQSNVYEGSGEVRVNGMIWKQIDFIVKLDDKNENAKDVDYKIEK